MTAAAPDSRQLALLPIGPERPRPTPPASAKSGIGRIAPVRPVPTQTVIPGAEQFCPASGQLCPIRNGDSECRHYLRSTVSCVLDVATRPIPASVSDSEQVNNDHVHASMATTGRHMGLSSSLIQYTGELAAVHIEELARHGYRPAVAVMEMRADGDDIVITRLTLRHTSVFWCRLGRHNINRGDTFYQFGMVEMGLYGSVTCCADCFEWSEYGGGRGVRRRD